MDTGTVPDPHAPGGPLLDPAALQRVLGDVTVLDVRWQLGRDDGRAQYLAGHVPGAGYVDLPTDLADPPGARGRHPLPDPERFGAAMRRCGVRARPAGGGLRRLVRDGRDPSVVAAAAPRPRRRTAPGRGLGLVAAGGRAGDLGRGAVAEGDFRPAPGRSPVLDADGAARVARGRRAAGRPCPGALPGRGGAGGPGGRPHPGRRQRPGRPTTSRADGSARSGTSPRCTPRRVEAPEVGAYCGSGVSATLDVFALHLLGREAALYPGSWSEWVHDPARPASVTET